MRNLHRWGAHLMVLSVTLHMARVFYTGAYKPPREFNWVVGVVLLFLTLGLSFTGYLLPWDQLAIWAVTVGTSLAGYSPFIAKQANFLLLGGADREPEHAAALVRAARARAAVRAGAVPGGPLLADPQGRRHLGTAVRERRMSWEDAEKDLEAYQADARRADLRRAPTGGWPRAARGPRRSARYRDAQPRGRGRARGARPAAAAAAAAAAPRATPRSRRRRRRGARPRRRRRGRRADAHPAPPRGAAADRQPPDAEEGRRRTSTACWRWSRPRGSSASSASRATASTRGRTC